MTTGYSGTANISGYFNSILEDAVFVAREDSLMPALVTPYNASGWADRKLSIYPQISAQTIGETEDLTTPTVFGKSSLQTYTPIEIGAQVILTDREMETDPQDARANAANELGAAMSTKIETDLVTLFQSFTTNVAGTAGSATYLHQFAAILSKIRYSKGRGPFNVVLHPYHWYDIWTEIGKPSTSVVASQAANSAMQDYFVANLISARWYQHALIPASSTNAYSGVFSREAIALDTRRAPRLEPERDSSLRAWELNISAGYAKGLRREEFGGYVLADITAPS